MTLPPRNYAKRGRDNGTRSQMHREFAEKSPDRIIRAAIAAFKAQYLIVMTAMRNGTS